MEHNKMKFCFIVNRAEFLLSHRYNLCLELLSRGHQVHVISPFERESVSQMKRDGLVWHEVEFRGESINPISAVTLAYRITILLKQIKPHLVHAIALKSVVISSLVTGLIYRVPFVGSVAGLGLVFTSNLARNRVIRWLIRPVLWLGFKSKQSRAVLQNDNDFSVLSEQGVLRHDRAVFTKGSGVDLSYFSPIICEADDFTVFFGGRLLRSKGILHLVDAVKKLHARGERIKLIIAGDVDRQNSDSIDRSLIEEWINTSFLEVVGHQADVRPYIGNSHVVCLPSFYGEGVPRILLEAAACGRPIITTDHPGCRDAITPQSGLLVEPRDTNAIVQALEALMCSEEVRSYMGEEARLYAEQEFGVDKVTAIHMNVYEELTSTNRPIAQ